MGAETVTRAMPKRRFTMIVAATRATRPVGDQGSFHRLHVDSN
ncbi:MAG: hypothetical protein RJB55_274, partial [Verrucomicrobiota bacterium]